MSTDPAADPVSMDPGSPPDASDVARLRAVCGDVHLRPWRLTEPRVRAYAAGLHALYRAGEDPNVAVLHEDPAAVLDPDREPALRPWDGPPPDGRDPVAVVVAGLRERPATWRLIERVLPVEAFVATHAKLGACVVAVAAIAGDDPSAWDAAAVRRWADAAAPRTPDEREFADNLASTVAYAPVVDAAFSDAPAR